MWGSAQVDITPDYPVRLNGFGGRRLESEGVRQRIYAKALAIQSGEQPPLVLVTVDNLGVRLGMVEEVAKYLAAAHHLPRANLALSFSHTHTAPKVIGASDNIFSEPIPPDHQQHIDRYTADLTRHLKQVADEAVQDLQPGHLAWGIGKVSFAMNRRTPGGPVDHDLPTLVVRDAKGTIRAILVTYACHCVTLSENKIGGDWAGYAQEALQRKFPSAVGLVSIGCGSDANPDSGVTGDQFELAAAQGGRKSPMRPTELSEPA